MFHDFEHPRFGEIMSIVALKNIRKGNYNNNKKVIRTNKKMQDVDAIFYRSIQQHHIKLYIQTKLPKKKRINKKPKRN